MLDSRQTLQLQLEVSETLTRSTTRDGIGLALAEVINRIVPFDFFLHSIWQPGTSHGYRISSRKTPEGTFEIFDDRELEKIRETDFESFIQAGMFLSDPANARIHQGEAFAALNDRFKVFQIGYHHHGIRSMMIFNMIHENGARHTMLISTRTDHAFKDSQYATINTVIPQIKMAFENLFKYDQLRQEEVNRKTQLELNNVLLGHTNRDDFGTALAEVLNKTVPCERFILRMWTGPVQLGYRLPLLRKPDGSFQRFSDLPMVQQAEKHPESMLSGSLFLAANPGVYQGDAFKKLCDDFPMFKGAAQIFGVQSVMVLSFRKDDRTCLLLMGNTTPNSFHAGQYELMQLLMPQIILAFENLFKYEKLRQEEQERKTQLDLMTAFNVQGDLEEMALNAISKMNEFIPFDYWMQISPIPTGQDLFFRLAYKENGRFQGIAGAPLFDKIKLEPIDIHAFMANHSAVFEKLALYVGEDFDTLKNEVPYFEALHQQLKLNSLAVFPITLMGKKETVLMMGSVRHYAFSSYDLDALNRIVPYISMAAQQYYSLFHIQRLTEQLEQEKNYLVEEIKSSHNFDEIIGSSHLMKGVFKKLAQVAPTDSTVLVLGETGTGKELIARAIHNQSPRTGKVLIKVNCASLPAQLIESELFGHEKGSFTGALEKRIGKFELANGGTIFLDEIGELPLELQAKLLRVLQEREIERIGGKATIPLDVRIIAATNRDLETEVAEGRFRSDLFYRLSVFPIQLPALRDRREDIPMLLAHFMQKFSRKMKRQLLGIKDETVREIMEYHWPGNIRELENVIEQAVIIGDTNSIKLKKSAVRKGEEFRPADPGPVKDEFSMDEITRVLRMTKGKIVGSSGAAAILDMRPSKVEEYERKWILDALRKCGGRIRGGDGAASLLGMKPTTLEARIGKLKIEKNEIFAKE